jgi:hypothetical protein
MQVIGLNNVPVAGDVFEVVESVDTAREKAESRVMSLRDERVSAKTGDGKVDLQVCSQLLVFAGDIVLMILYIFDH